MTFSSFSSFAFAQQSKPNIVWLTTEDNSANWYRLYNPKGAPMPTIERLAKSGLVFNNAYSCAPVCSAARSTIISGCYASRLGAHFHRQQKRVEMPDGIKMFPWYLRQAGYYTTNNSKKDYNFFQSAENGVWDESSNQASYRKRKPGQPFFHVQNYGATHEGQLFGGLPKGEELRVDPESVDLFPYHPDTPLMRQKYAEYLTRQTIVDRQMGEFVAQLEKDGLLDDTFIFHYGDHGGVLPGSKGYAYNDGLQVAMVVYIPKNWQHLAPAERGSRIDGFVEFVDLSATVLNLAGVDLPKGIDGEPFLGKGIELDELNSRDMSFSYADRFDEKYDMVRTLHKGRFHYMRNYQPFNFDGLYAFYRYKQPAFTQWRDMYIAGKLNAEQSRFFEPRPPECLYDLQKDPHEVNNLADDPEYADTLKELRRLMQQQVKGMPDVGFVPESVLLKERNGKVYTYGRQNSERIEKLVDIADLQLLPFEQAKTKISRALGSDDELERYWAMINCSAFGEEASCFYNDAKKLAANDPCRLVRVRAAEFLALNRQADPRPVLVEVLNETDDPIEANLILNTVVLLRDGECGYDFNVNDIKNASWMKKSGEFTRRLEYLK